MALSGRSDGNPFIDYSINAEFKNENETVNIHGFYDGDGVYRVRFMPSFEGQYTYKVLGSFSDTCTEGNGAFRNVWWALTNEYGLVGTLQLSEMGFAALLGQFCTGRIGASQLGGNHPRWLLWTFRDLL